jgi:hypothetical protein
MVCFQTKNPNLGKVLQWKMMVPIFYGHLVHFTVFCYMLLTIGIVRGNLVSFYRFGILYQEKSGNPGVWPDSIREKMRSDRFCEYKQYT